ncbi:SAM-dependent methyltransferase [Kitasatospora sp. GP30]|nr:SAM-dependent methyltransferase [Kitasatospora sp. GP30]
MTSPTTDFGAVGGSYAHYNTSGRGRLRHDLVTRRLRADLPRTPAGVLDLGCGDGEMTLRLASAGHRVTGVDPSAGMLASAAERLGTRPETAGRVRLLQADIATLPTDLGVFDALCCHGVLMHLDDSGRQPGLLEPRILRRCPPGHTSAQTVLRSGPTSLVVSTTVSAGPLVGHRAVLLDALGHRPNEATHLLGEVHRPARLSCHRPGAGPVLGRARLALLRPSRPHSGAGRRARAGAVDRPPGSRRRPGS